MSRHPVAFMSYVRLDDQHENGRLTAFRDRLSGEVRMQTGEMFHIFQDRNDIAWGQQWRQRIDESLDAVTFLIPVVTPAFFRSLPCREEFELFLRREERLGRGDLILPVYYVDCPVLSDETKRESDSLAKAIAARQYADWRELRFEPFTTPEIGKKLAAMARQIVEALERGQPAPAQQAVSARHEAPTITPREASSPPASGPARGPVAKTEPPTLVVDALHRGDHVTLTQALQAANPGDRLLVRPGLYKEGVVIDKPVEIVGDGEPGEVVIEASGKDVVLFKATMGRIVNLTLRQTGNGDWYCIDITQGRLELEGCDITSQSLACVGIHGGADPRLRRNRIHDGKAAGVFVYENGQGTLEDNEIFANALAGAEIKTSGNPTLRRNRIADNRYKGVWVYNEGAGTFENNDLRGNAQGAWDVAPDCKSRVKRAGNLE